MAKKALFDQAQSSGIGSLPYHNSDAAIDHAFSMSLPFLPQIPARYPAESMIAQALDGFPGMTLRQAGFVSVDLPTWIRGRDALEEQLLAATSSEAHGALEGFEPQSHFYSCWNPFLFELEERQLKRAKIQIAGPLTCQWVMQLSDGSPIIQHEKLSSQIFRFVLARAVSMIRKVKAQGTDPIFFLDEPGLCVLNTQNPLHQVALRELRWVVQMLQREGVAVGIHCCSNIDWKGILGLGLDLLSFDVKLSLQSLLSGPLQDFLSVGGTPSFGIIPTGLDQQNLSQINATQLFEDLYHSLKKEGLEGCLKTALFTPACGLGLRSTEDAHQTLHKMSEILKLARR